MRGVAFPAGTVVFVASCTANRDGLEEPDRFDIARTDGGRLTTFGAGIHYCLGANLARAELQEGLAFLAAHVDRLELDGEPVYGSVTGIYGPIACRFASKSPRPRPHSSRARSAARGDPVGQSSGVASIMPSPCMTAADVNLRTVLRIVLVIVGVVLCLYVLYLLRKPLGWIVLATFIAVAMSAPVNLLARHMHRGLAIALAYLGLLAVPVLLALILIPPIVNGVDDLAVKAPDYAAQAQDYVQKNQTLRKLEDDYGVITELETQAKKLPAKLGPRPAR